MPIVENKVVGHEGGVVVEVVGLWYRVGFARESEGLCLRFARAIVERGSGR